MKKQVRGVLILTGLCLGLIGSIFAAGRDTLMTVQERRKLIVGLAPEFQPFEFKNSKGEIIGFDVDIAKRIAKELGVELEIKEYKWDKLLFALKWQEIDMIISGMTRTLSRAMYVNFSEPYFQTGQVVVVSNKNRYMESYKQLNATKMKVAVVKETTGEEVAKKKLPDATLVPFAGESDVVEQLLSGKVDAFVFDKPYAVELKAEYPQLKVLNEQLSFESYSIALDDSDLHFLLWINLLLEELKLSGDFDQLFNYWFVEKSWKEKTK